MRMLLLCCVLLAACDKPTEADCQKAVDNINKIYKANDDDTALAQAVRRCRGQSTKATVQCMIAAKTIEDAEGCEGKTQKKK